MKSTITRVAMTLAAVGLTGCFTMNASVPGTLRADIDETDTEKVGDFEHEIQHFHIPWGLGDAPEGEFRTELLTAAKEQGADGAANLKYESYVSFMDIIFNAVTCSILGSKTHKMSGDLVRIKKPPLPGAKPTDAAPGGAMTVDKSDLDEPEVAVRY